MVSLEQVHYTKLDRCVYCPSSELVLLRGERLVHEAKVWNGIEWLSIKHGTKECKKCRTYYKLTYIAGVDTKMNTIQDLDDQSMIMPT